MKKRLLSLVLCLVFVVSLVPTAFAANLGMATSIANPIEDINEFTPKAYKFQIEGDNTEFILLDAGYDDNQKFYVMTVRDYGTMSYDPDGTQKYDPTDANNIAWWLNNTFLTEGAADGSKLPEEVIKYINPNSKYDVEAGCPSGDVPTGYTVECAVGLLGHYEYEKWYHKFGVRDNMSGSAWWLRTPFGKGDPDIMLVPKISDAEVNGRTIQWTSKNKLLVRPTFYLTKDFFKNVKVQVPTIGSEVKKALLANYKEDDFRAVGYTDDEIEMIKDTTMDVSENFSVKVLNTEEIGGIVTPENAAIEFTGLIGGLEKKTYEIYFQIEELDYPKTVARIELSPGVEVKKTYKLEGINNGIGTLQVKVKQGDRVSCSMEELIFVMPKYEPQFMDEYSEHGVGTHYPQAGQSNSNDTYLLERAGIKKLRDSIGWGSLELEDGTWTSDKTDVYVPSVTLDAGVDWIAILYGTHANYTDTPPSTSKGISGFVNYAEHLMDIYPQINKYEIWNEPNLSNWKPKPNGLEYQKLAKALGKSILDKNPNAEVWGGSINSFDNTYTINMMKDGLYPYITHYSYHPYITPAEVDAEYEMKWDRLINTTLSYGGWKDIGVTEVGWPTHDSPQGNSEPKQALEVPKMYIVADAMNLKGNAYYTFRDPGSDPRENEDMFGLIRRSLEPKLSYMSVTQLNIALGGAVYVGQMFMDGDLTAHVYMKDHKPVIAMWTTKGDTVTDYDFGEAVTVVDLYGNPVEPKSGNTYSIGREIYYVTGANTSWFAKAVGQFDGKKAEELLSDYSAGMPADVIADLTASKDYLKSLENATYLPSEAEITEKMDAHYDIGTKLLNAHKAGTTGMSDTDVSIALFLMHRIGVGYGNLLAASSTTAGELTSKERVKELEAKIDARQEAYYDGSVQFTEAMVYYARKHSNWAEYVKTEQGNPSKNGIMKAFDKLANEVLDWASIWVEFEPAISTSFLIEVPVDDTSVFAGEERQINVGIRSYSNDAQTGKVEIYDPNGKKFAETAEFTANPDTVSSTVLNAKFEYDFQGVPQEFTLKFVKSDGTLLGSALVQFNLQDKISVKYNEVNVTYDKVSELTVNLTNIYTGPVSGTLKLTAPQGWSIANPEAAYSLDKDETKSFTFKVTGTSQHPFNIYLVRTELYEDSGLRIVDLQYPLSFTPIVKNTGTISLDDFKGDITDWTDAYPLFINHPKDASSLTDWHNADIGGMVFLKWDEKNLYMLYNFYDDKYYQNSTGNGMWSNDSVQYSLDCYNTKTAGYDTDDYEIGFAYTKNGVENYCWTAPNSEDGGDWSDKITAMVRDDALRLTRSLLVVPKERVAPLELYQGNKIGFNVAFNDADRDKREEYVQITNGTANGKNPRYYYTYEMVGPQNGVSAAEVDKYNTPLDMQMDYENSFSSFGAVFVINEEEEEVIFTDIKDHWAKADIENMYKREIVDGVGDKKFEPDREITRAEFMALLAKSGVELVDYKGTLSDVKAEDWHAKYIQAGIDYSIIPAEMYADGSFKPDQPITREEMAVMVVKMYEYKKGAAIAPGTSAFTDEGSFSPWAVDAVNAASKAGIVNGKGNGIFDPLASATRAEATVIVKRLLNLI